MRRERKRQGDTYECNLHARQYADRQKASLHTVPNGIPIWTLLCECAAAAAAAIIHIIIACDGNETKIVAEPSERQTDNPEWKWMRSLFLSCPHRSPTEWLSKFRRIIENFRKRFMIMSLVESVENFQFLLQLWRLTDAHLICWFETHQYTYAVVIGPSQGIHWTRCLCLFLIDLWIVHCYVLHEPFFVPSVWGECKRNERCPFYATCAVVPTTCIECICESECASSFTVCVCVSRFSFDFGCRFHLNKNVLPLFWLSLRKLNNKEQKKQKQSHTQGMKKSNQPRERENFNNSKKDLIGPNLVAVLVLFFFLLRCISVSLYNLVVDTFVRLVFDDM